MLEVSKYIEESLDYVMKADVTADLNKDFIYQEEFFNSEDFNHTFTKIEEHLNELYEKTRMLQEIVEYAKAHIRENVNTISEECKSILDSIEISVDSLRNKNYISYPVYFIDTNGPYRDRSNITLPRTMIQDRTITLSYNPIKDNIIQNMKRLNSLVCYKENLSDLINNKPYRVFYMIDDPVKDGLIEEIECTLHQEEPINYLDIVPSNCEIVAVKYINEAGIEEYVQDYKNVVQQRRRIKKIVVYIRAKSYEQKTYYVDESRMKNYFWSIVESNEYENKIGLNSETATPSQLDEISGIAQFKRDYEAYIKQVKDWLARRQAVVEENKKRGYEDSVGDYVIVQPPSSLNLVVDPALATNSLTSSRMINQQINHALSDYTVKQDEVISTNQEIATNALSSLLNTGFTYLPDSEKCLLASALKENYAQNKMVNRSGTQLDYNDIYLSHKEILTDTYDDKQRHDGWNVTK